MTTVYPVSGATDPKTETPAVRDPKDQFGQDTFLKLLVAQLKYQDPLNPTDSSQFLTQTAQFTQLETLQKIEKSLAASEQANHVLAASGMVGRSVTYAVADGSGPAPTTTVSLRGSLSQDAPVGSHTTVTSARGLERENRARISGR